MIKKTICIALAVVSTAGLVSAKDYHVGNEYPLKTISAAAKLAQPGDTIMVHEGSLATHGIPEPALSPG